MNEEMSHNDRITYLQMIQGVIDRMSNTSAIFKGFAATIIAGVSVISFADISGLRLALALFPVLCFWYMDAYYYQLERKYRILYEKVRNGDHEIDFSMDAVCTSEELRNEKACICKCLFAPSVMRFYLPVCLIGAGLLILKF